MRDFVLKRAPKDLDLATDARPDEIIYSLRGWEGVGSFHLDGKDFGVIRVNVDDGVYEIATFRGDRYDGETRKPVVEYTNTIEDDLARRDFTMNAMAIEITPGSGRRHHRPVRRDRRSQERCAPHARHHAAVVQGRSAADASSPALQSPSTT